MKTFVKTSALLFAASTCGWAILISLAPERLHPSDPRLNAFEHTFYWMGAFLALPSVPLITLVEQFRPAPVGQGWILAACLSGAVFWAAEFLLGIHFWKCYRGHKVTPLITYRLKRRVFWKLTHLVSVIKMRRRLLVAGFLIPVCASILITLTTKRQYSSMLRMEIGDHPNVTFCPMGTGNQLRAEQNGATNRSHPISSGTNRTSGAAGSSR
jgi:hypothetical protein